MFITSNKQRWQRASPSFLLNFLMCYSREQSGCEFERHDRSGREWPFSDVYRLQAGWGRLVSWCLCLVTHICANPKHGRWVLPQQQMQRTIWGKVQVHCLSNHGSRKMYTWFKQRLHLPTNLSWKCQKIPWTNNGPASLGGTKNPYGEREGG